MPLVLTTFSESPLFVGYTWNIADEEKLIRILTLLVVGDHVHATEILRGTQGLVAPQVRAVLDRAAAELREPRDRYHRDGWLFQLISWIAIQKAASTGAIIRAPQARMADKGFDGLVVEIPSTDRGYLIVCEDKATENPRATIIGQVWPEFKRIEAHDRDRELTSEVSTLLFQLPDLALRRRLIEEAIWQDNKHYRITITGAGDDDPPGRRALLADYQACVGGPEARRRAEVIYVSDVRLWMDRVASLVANKLDAWETPPRV
jgi:hypothetical protein